MKEYEDKIANLLYNVIKEIYAPVGQDLKTIKTINHQAYEVIKIQKEARYSFSGYKLHELFNPKGYKISGELNIIVHVYLPLPDDPRNMSKDATFKFTFNDILLKFNYDIEEFEICSDININSITKL